MNKLWAYCQLSLADFRERTRRSSFLVTMLGVLFFGYLVITGKYTVQFGEFRTVYDSTWAGTLMASCSSVLLTLIGFYLIRGSVKRDRHTEVGQIIAATPMSRSAYLTSKFISNCLVLWFMAAVLAAVGFVTLLFRNETDSIGIGAFLLPFFTILIPATIFVAAITVLFDTARWLRGSIGNVIYLFFAEMCIVMGMLSIPLLDLGGITLFTDSVREAAAVAFPGEKVGLLMGFVMFDPAMKIEGLRVFPWDGIVWTTPVLLTRLFWIGVGLAAIGITVPLFDRFDPARARVRRGSKKKKLTPVLSKTESSGERPDTAYAELGLPVIRFSLINLVIAELRLALKGFHWFWFMIAIGLMVAQLAAPFEICRQYLTPASLVWPLVIWSSMGTREYLFNTEMLLFSSPKPVTRQLPAVWLSGFVVAVASISVMLIRSASTGHLLYAASLMTAALFIPSAALSLGVISRSKRLFEIIYLMIWYIGSIEHLTALDLLGTFDESITELKFLALFSLTILFLMTAFGSRRAQVLRA